MAPAAPDDTPWPHPDVLDAAVGDVVLTADEKAAVGDSFEAVYAAVRNDPDGHLAWMALNSDDQYAIHIPWGLEAPVAVNRRAIKRTVRACWTQPGCRVVAWSSMGVPGLAIVHVRTAHPELLQTAIRDALSEPYLLNGRNGTLVPVTCRPHVLVLPRATLGEDSDAFIRRLPGGPSSDRWPN